MPDLSDFPVQGKLRIRQDGFERDAEYIRAHVGYVSEPVLKSVPGYAFLKFYYADFAATPGQWAVLAPELDKRNILVTLYEAPVLYMEALEEEEKAAKPQEPRDTHIWVYNGAAIVLVVVSGLLLAGSVIDATQCILAGAIAAGVAIAGQVHARTPAKTR
jgi:hypothetical protein